MARLDGKLERQRLDAAGYVEFPGGPLCGNCEYGKDKDRPRGRCVHPSVMAEVDMINGCCSLWRGDDKEKTYDSNDPEAKQ